MNGIDEQRSPALDRAAEGTDGWGQVVRHQRHATPDHADFYALAGEIVTTLHALDDLAEVLAGQVAGYAQGRPVYDDTRTVDPAARLAEATALLRDTRKGLRTTVVPANRFWSAIGHIGTETTP
ncbi:hypothetical protein [Pseudonocardia abyssalis]|uniref:Uncharacterized protein n=1 Tax=Pseudonocardia abyssalis TaxID=2792008 RepID=A0ABS6V2D5_9PSEU|nr:hypothetical protein [Pseudonocardia abyssalis]MBW0114179.1 hypothetical protein [Pseudonocardia abyssalis]MBW0138572.1 hypothetical protein [Pseudonocardia abyssalis]